MSWMLAIAGAAGLIGALSGLFVWISNMLTDFRVADLRDRMIASQRQGGPVGAALPEVVRAYAVRAGGRIGAPSVFHARQEAALARNRQATPISIVAEQWTGTVAPGIVWSAKGRMNGLPVSVLDAYVEGRGELSARMLGVFKVAGGIGADYDKGELMRYLSELPVYPDAMLNATGLTWRQLDDHTAEVTARSASGPATVRFIFDDSGDIVRLEADNRPMADEAGRMVSTPWHGIYRDYTQFGRYRIPAYGEVGWVLPEGLFTYWRGRVVSYEPLAGEAKR